MTTNPIWKCVTIDSNKPSFLTMSRPPNNMITLEPGDYLRREFLISTISKAIISSLESGAGNLRLLTIHLKLNKEHVWI